MKISYLIERQNYNLRYEELIAEERLLSNEVQALSDKIEIWSKQRPGQYRSESLPPQSASARKIDASNSNLLPEIIEYDVNNSISYCQSLSFVYSVFYLNVVAQQEIGMNMIMEHFSVFEINIRFELRKT